MKKMILSFALISLSTSASALFCPNNFNQMTIGDTIEQVQKACGKPDAEKKSHAEENGPQEWSYYVHPQTSNYTGMSTNSTQQAALKMSVAFNEGKVVNITVNGMSLAATTICGSGIAVGDLAKNVKSACGNPLVINKSSQSNDEKPAEIIQYKYNSTPPTTLIFENGILKERR